MIRNIVFRCSIAFGFFAIAAEASHTDGEEMEGFWVVVAEYKVAILLAKLGDCRNIGRVDGTDSAQGPKGNTAGARFAVAKDVDATVEDGSCNRTVDVFNFWTVIIVVVINVAVIVIVTLAVITSLEFIKDSDMRARKDVDNNAVSEILGVGEVATKASMATSSREFCARPS